MLLSTSPFALSLSLLPHILLASASAPITTHNPSSASIQANLFAFNQIQGTITGVTPSNGTGTSFNINFFAFPGEGAPFSYYISEATSIPGGNCSSLTQIFNPYSASGTCKASDPKDCAVGALSAKHASISPTSTSYSFQAFITDDYLSTAPGTEAYFGGRAIVVADKSGKPINCGGFPGTAVKESSSATSSASGTVTSATSGSATSASAAATSTAAAAGRMVSAGSGMAAVAGVVAMLL